MQDQCFIIYAAQDFNHISIYEGLAPNASIAGVLNLFLTARTQLRLRPQNASLSTSPSLCRVRGDYVVRTCFKNFQWKKANNIPYQLTYV